MNEEKFPIIIYNENDKKVIRDFMEGKVSYMDFTSWSFQDNFFAFLLGIKFFERCGSDYPSPRAKEEVPLWFLLICQIQLKLHQTSVYSKLPGLLKNGSVLTRIKFNIGAVGGGFNNKNKKDRETPVDQDAVRKYFKDTDRQLMNEWYNRDCLRFIRHNRGIDKRGIFILDQSKIVVPDNKNYKRADYLLVNEYGHRIDTKNMTEEQKKALKPRLCYALSTLLHVGADGSYVVCGYKLGGGKTDELPQGIELLEDFIKGVGKGAMKLLIMDRGYIDGQFIKMIKEGYESEVLIPLRSNMTALTDAIRIAEAYKNGDWEIYDSYHNKRDGITYTDEVTYIKDIEDWENCGIKMYISLMRRTGSDGKVRYWGLISTYKPQEAKECFETYKLRTQVEERYKQFKQDWKINKFSSPNDALVETHVAFTLLTYSLLQLYLNKHHLIELAHKTITTLKQEESIGEHGVIVYSGNEFAVIHLYRFLKMTLELDEVAKEKLKKWIEEVIQEWDERTREDK